MWRGAGEGIVGLHGVVSIWLVVCVLLKSCRDGWSPRPPLSPIVLAIDTLILPGGDGVEMTTDVTATSS